VMTIFSLHVQTDPGSNPATYTKGTGSFSGIKRSGRGVDNPHSPNAEVKDYRYTSTPQMDLPSLF
jgi:hypothetical protein